MGVAVTEDSVVTSNVRGASMKCPAISRIRPNALERTVVADDKNNKAEWAREDAHRVESAFGAFLCVSLASAALAPFNRHVRQRLFVY